MLRVITAIDLRTTCMGFKPLSFIRKYMKLNNVTAKISETDLEAMIKKTVLDQSGLKVRSVTFNIGQRTTGYGMNETTTYYFEGATILFENNKKD